MNHPFKFRFLILILCIFLLPAIVFVMADNYYGERSTRYIKQKVVAVSSKIFSETLNETSLQIDMDKLVQYQYDTNHKITSIFINTSEISQIQSKAAQKLDDLFASPLLEEKIKEIEIPVGGLISKTIFAGKGPNIQIQSMPVSSYLVNIETSNTEYGINNTLFEIYLLLKTSIETIVPLNNLVVETDTKILLVSQVIQGEVPKYYYQGKGEMPYFPEN